VALCQHWSLAQRPETASAANFHVAAGPTDAKQNAASNDESDQQVKSPVWL
jgi:hypothetical protein